MRLLVCRSVIKMRTISHSHARASINSRRTTLNGRGDVFRLNREFVLVRSVVLPVRCSHIRRKRPHIVLEPAAPRRTVLCVQIAKIYSRFTRKSRRRTLFHTGHDPRRFHENSASRRNPITAIRAQHEPSNWRLRNNNQPVTKCTASHWKTQREFKRRRCDW